jgi:hypothetical protein
MRQHGRGLHRLQEAEAVFGVSDADRRSELGPGRRTEGRWSLRDRMTTAYSKCGAMGPNMIPVSSETVPSISGIVSEREESLPWQSQVNSRRELVS